MNVDRQSGPSRKAISYCIVLAFMAICFLFSDMARAETQRIRRVLVLNSYHSTRRWTQLIMKGIESTLGQYEGKIILDVEYMDAKRFEDEKHYENLLALYKHKIGRRRYDVVITVDSRAFVFFLQRRNELCPDVPVVFCGINNFRESMLQGHDSVTGIIEGETFEPTVEMALKLHSSAKQVLVLLDERELKVPSNWPERLEKFAQQLDRRVEFTASFLPEPNKRELIKTVEGLGKESVIIFAGKFTRSGELQIFKGVAPLISRRCSAPIYCLSEQWFGYAPVMGGKFDSGFYQGRAAAEMAIRILNGESLQNIPIRQGGLERYMFDYAQLKRFGISFSKLPENSVIVDEPESFYYLYRERIWATAAIIAALVIVVMILSANILRRKQAEKALLGYQSQLKSLTSQLSVTEEREKRRIATELHDQIGETLTTSKTKLESLCRAASSRGFVKGLNEVCGSLGQTIQDTRSLTSDLSYPILYELGFGEAVAQWLSEQIQQKHSITTEFESDGCSEPLDDDVRALLFRDVRELLVNVVKHANAHKVRVCSRRVDNKIQVSVEDDGVGFDVKKATSVRAKTGGFGLFSIRERLEQLGGRLRIESVPGRGTKVTILAPLGQKEVDSGVQI